MLAASPTPTGLPAAQEMQSDTSQISGEVCRAGLWDPWEDQHCDGVGGGGALGKWKSREASTTRGLCVGL